MGRRFVVGDEPRVGHPDSYGRARDAESVVRRIGGVALVGIGALASGIRSEIEY